MITYWDTSAVVNSAVSAKVAARLDSGEHYVRLHVFAEFFSIITGRGIQVLDNASGLTARFKFTPEDAATWLRNFSTKVKVVELELAETLTALDKTQKMGLQGARIHDYFHAVAADKIKSKELLTRNTEDFSNLGQAALVWP